MSKEETQKRDEAIAEKDYIENIALKYIPIRNRKPTKDGYYLIILDNDISIKAVVWYFKDLDLWGKSKNIKGELKQEMVTHWLEQTLLTFDETTGEMIRKAV